MLTKTALPFALIPASKLNNTVAINTIKSCPDLFKIIMPININHFKSLLDQHPNHPLVDSVCRSLQEGAWPFMTINPKDPITFDFSSHTLNDSATLFVWEQHDLEISEEQYSCSFRMELLPGMYSPPIGAVPKPHSTNLQLINDHSTGPHSLNAWIDKVDGHICLDNLHDLGTLLCSIITTCHRHPLQWLFKSDVSAMYCWPMILYGNSNK